jgi:hypothetical protein
MSESLWVRLLCKERGKEKLSLMFKGKKWEWELLLARKPLQVFMKAMQE